MDFTGGLFVCENPWARTPIGASGNFSYYQNVVMYISPYNDSWTKCRHQTLIISSRGTNYRTGLTINNNSILKTSCGVLKILKVKSAIMLKNHSKLKWEARWKYLNDVKPIYIYYQLKIIDKRVKRYKHDKITECLTNKM